MTSFATASTFERIKILEAALEKVLDRDGMFISGDEEGRYVWIDDGLDNCPHHYLRDLASELEAMLS